MVAKRNADVRDLNHRARDTLLDNGQLGDRAVVLGGRELREGERVVAGINNHRVGVRNGTTGTLQHIDHDTLEPVLGELPLHVEPLLSGDPLRRS